MKIRVLAAAALVLLSAVLAACDVGPAAQTNQRKVVVSSKNFTEAVLVGEMYAQVLENAGIPIERKMNLGGTDVAQAALEKGGAADGIDLYPEYTGTGLLAVLKGEPESDPQKVYDIVKQGYADKFKITWLDRSPMNDTQAVITTKEVSDSKGIKTLQDLCDKAGELTMIARAEFKDRPDALPALQRIYGGCDFKEIKAVESGDLVFAALLNGQADVAASDSTAGPIAGNDLVLLEDPKGYGGPYNIAPVVRDDVLALYPNIATTLNTLSPKITTEEIARLNWEVDGKKREVTDVAKEVLTAQGLLK
ncbi:MAG TPA: glycine betaine ABC transporter substrate-binding protein [Chloroflexia bacterium]|nr:glycine betaine ABC transporter substrate-binding protein [Chloroflexia bacterium]